MRAMHSIASICAAALVCGHSIVHAQDYPTRPIRIITSSTGSSTDTISRLVAQGLTASMGQPVIVDNRGGGFIQGEMVAKAAPDGYTMVIAAGGLWVSPLLQKAPYDPLKDFAPISLTTTTPNVLFVHPSVAASSPKELIAFAKANPGRLNYASGATGGTSHLAGELLNYLAGTNIVRIPYKSGAQQVADLLSGQVQVQFNTPDGYQDHLRSGRLRALAVGSTKPSALLPGVPPLSSTLPGFESVVNLGMFAPANTPRAVVLRLNQEVVRILKTEEARTRLTAIAVEPVGGSPDDLMAAVKAEISRFGKLVKSLGIEVK